MEWGGGRCGGDWLRGTAPVVVGVRDCHVGDERPKGQMVTLITGVVTSFPKFFYVVLA